MQHRHFKLYKPYGMLSQMHSNDAKEKNKRFLRELFDFPNGTMPVGRLDEKSEGLLLMTTDGQLSDRVNRWGIEKEYFVQLDGLISPESMEKLSQGVEIGFSGSRYLTRPCRVRALDEPPHLPLPDPGIRIDRHRPSSWISVSIKEGKFRQVRKMTAAVGFPTLRLVRVRIGNVYLENLKPGDVEALESLFF